MISFSRLVPTDYGTENDGSCKNNLSNQYIGHMFNYENIRRRKQIKILSILNLMTLEESCVYLLLAFLGNFTLHVLRSVRFSHCF